MVPPVRLALLLAVLLAPAALFGQVQPACSITIQPPTVQGATDVTVSWTTTGAVQCVASGGWSGPKNCAGGSQVFADLSDSRTFNLTVRAATGRLVFNWTRPAFNTDGTPTTIAGYRLYVADTAANVPSATPLALPADALTHTLFVAPGLRNGGIRAVRTDGVESAMSNIVAKTVTALSGTCSGEVTVTSRPRAPVLSALIGVPK